MIRGGWATQAHCLRTKSWQRHRGERPIDVGSPRRDPAGDGLNFNRCPVTTAAGLHRCRPLGLVGHDRSCTRSEGPHQLSRLITRATTFVGLGRRQKLLAPTVRRIWLSHRGAMNECRRTTGCTCRRASSSGWPVAYRPPAAGEPERWGTSELRPFRTPTPVCCLGCRARVATRLHDGREFAGRAPSN